MHRMPDMSRIAGKLRLMRGRRKPARPTSTGDRLSPKVDRNEALMRETLGDSFDLTFRTLQPDQEGRRLLLVYLRGAVDEKLVADAVLRPLGQSGFPVGGDPRAVFASLRDRYLAAGTVETTPSLQGAIDGILLAKVALLVDGVPEALLIFLPAWPTRGLLEPETEVNIRGSRDGFSTLIIDNTAVLRRYVKDPRLRFERREIGRLSRTKVVVAHIAGLAPDSLVAEACRRLDKVKLDGVLATAYIEELIRDHRWSPFPTTFRTERPDRVAAALLEGRVAILVDGTQFVLIVPAVLTMFLTTVDDWYESFLVGTALRILRYASFVVSLLFPALYVSAISFHQEMVPTRLAFGITQQRQGIPFPVIVEALLLQLIFEVLREAGLRLPQAVGQAVTIVGALIVGQQAVEAGLVSPVMLIVIATTGIASFVTPVYSMSWSVRLLNPLYIILGGTLGLFGIVSGLVLMEVHLTALNSFGLAYMSPLSPSRAEELKDTFIRWPLWASKRRPKVSREDHQG